MITRKFALTILASTFLGIGAAQAAGVFPNAAEESGYGPSVNASLPEMTHAVDLTLRNSTFPSDPDSDRVPQLQSGYSGMAGGVAHKEQIGSSGKDSSSPFPGSASDD